jgi:hypothetical protein
MQINENATAAECKQTDTVLPIVHYAVLLVSCLT